MMSFFTEQLLNELKCLGNGVIIEIRNGDVIVFESDRDFEDGVPICYFRQKMTWRETLKERNVGE